ncbi:MAG: hypothetical protein J6Q85_02200 [Clostridia bacterium]|nr:hypothetical protein [Clostridia bacterium]
MENAAKWAYESYKKLSAKPYTSMTTVNLNVLYNILCRAKRDEEYRSALTDYKTEEGDGIVALIEKYFDDYNAQYGLEIRDTLTEFEDQGLAAGSYFVITTYKLVDGKRVECPPTEFKKGEIALVKATLYSHSDNTAATAPTLRAIWLDDDGKSGEAVCEDESSIEFELTLSREGCTKFKVIAETKAAKTVPGSEIAYGGVVFSLEEIKATHLPPEDLSEFWEKEIERMYLVDPKSEVSDGYDGDVAWLFDMPKKNFYSLKKLSKDDFDALLNNKLSAPDKELLKIYDFYQVYLKCPGPCHASGYLTVPKGKAPSSLPILISYDGYGTNSPPIHACDDKISLHCTHHGYELGHPKKEYYDKLGGDGCILSAYGTGASRPNAGYENIHDCYMLYLNIRNMQMLRYITDESLSGDIASLHEIWNGNIELLGGSMGGYQAICTSALAHFIKKRGAKFNITETTANIPAFCNLAGLSDNRIPHIVKIYKEGMDYFDPATLAHLIDNHVVIPRIGLGDESCPATTIISFFNSLGKDASVDVSFLQNSSHGYVPKSSAQFWHKYSYPKK